MTIEIDDIKTLSVGPGQLLVVKVEGCITSQTKDLVLEVFGREAPDLKGRVLVIDQSITLAVVDTQAA